LALYFPPVYDPPSEFYELISVFLLLGLGLATRELRKPLVVIIRRFLAAILLVQQRGYFFRDRRL